VIVNISSGIGDLRPLDRSAGRAAASNNRVGYATTKAALNRMTNALAPELAADNIAAICVAPGFTRTELVDLLGERGFVDPDAAHDMSVPVDAVVGVILADDPLRYAGQVVQAKGFAEDA